MTTLLTSLPGDIPGLLRRWSPTLITIDSDLPPVQGVVVEPVYEPDEVDPRCLVWHRAHGLDNKAKMFVALHLTDPTGRAHAASWAYHRPGAYFTALSRNERDIIELALHYGPMDQSEIDALARLVLRLAGRTP